MSKDVVFLGLIKGENEDAFGLYEWTHLKQKI
jgi:hypothetical protein